MTQDDRWKDFLKNGSVLAYLSYAANKKAETGSGKVNENSNSGSNNKGDEYRGK